MGLFEDEFLQVINCSLPEDMQLYQSAKEDHLNQCGTLAQLYFKSQQGIVLVPFLLLPLTLIIWAILMFLSLPSKMELTVGKPAGLGNVITVALVIFVLGLAFYIIFGIGNFITEIFKL